MPAATALTDAEARRIAVRAQALDGSARDVLDVVRRSGALQLDPTARVAPNHVLAIWSRLGRYEEEVLRRLLRERALVEFRAFIYAVEDLPLMRARARSVLSAVGGWEAWMRANARFRSYVLRELRARGPLSSDALEDRAKVPWASSGWTADRNRTKMLELLEAQGEVMVSGRAGAKRLWDVTERVVRVRDIDVDDETLSRRLAERLLRTSGIARRSALKSGYLPRPDLDGLGDRVSVEGTAGDWIVQRDRPPDAPLAKRLTLLSPFDRLIHDRVRSADLFDFEYAMEIYVPKEKRRYGYYVMPVLHGERIVGRIDPEVDRRAGVLRVNGVFPEAGARIPALALKTSLRSLAAATGVTKVEIASR